MELYELRECTLKEAGMPEARDAHTHIVDSECLYTAYFPAPDAERLCRAGLALELAWFKAWHTIGYKDAPTLDVMGQHLKALRDEQQPGTFWHEFCDLLRNGLELPLDRLEAIAAVLKEG